MVKKCQFASIPQDTPDNHTDKIPTPNTEAVGQFVSTRSGSEYRIITSVTQRTVRTTPQIKLRLKKVRKRIYVVIQNIETVKLVIKSTYDAFEISVPRKHICFNKKVKILETKEKEMLRYTQHIARIENPTISTPILGIRIVPSLHVPGQQGLISLRIFRAGEYIFIIVTIYSI